MLLAVAPPILSPIFGTEAAELVRLISPLPLLVGIAAVPTALAQRNLRFRLTSGAATGSAVVGSVTAVMAAAAGPGHGRPRARSARDAPSKCSS